MKQFFICLFLSLLFHFIASIMGGSFNPMDWKNNDGKFWYGMILFFIWLTPMMFNYLNGKDNFK